MNTNLKESYKDKRALVTGGLGFIGSNLVLKLMELGANVTIVDSMIPDFGGNLFNIEPVKNEVKINFSDIRDSSSMEYLIRGQDYLFNLAGQVSHIDSMNDPYTDLEINVRGQLSILESCRKFNPKIKVVYASTRQFYGKPDYLPVDEKHPLRPVDVNGINKMAGEWYHILYNNVYGIRIPNWTSFHLDTLPDGQVIKPDLFFMEAIKPLALVHESKFKIIEDRRGG